MNEHDCKHSHWDWDQNSIYLIHYNPGETFYNGDWQKNRDIAEDICDKLNRGCEVEIPGNFRVEKLRDSREYCELGSHI